ncbi:unnamed protein product, partial [Polarella glacialis]
PHLVRTACPGSPAAPSSRAPCIERRTRERVLRQIICCFVRSMSLCQQDWDPVMGSLFAGNFIYFVAASELLIFPFMHASHVCACAPPIRLEVSRDN